MLNNELVPAAEPRSRKLLVVLHGLGDSMEGFRWLPAAFNLPWLNYLLVDAPDPYYTGYSWYDFTGDADTGVRRSRQLLFKVLDAQWSNGWASEQTMLFGFSQGCLVALDVAWRYPSRLAGVVGVSGYVHEPEVVLRELSAAARQMPVLFTHGTFDPLVPCAPVREQVQSLQKHGLPIQWREFPKAHTIAGEEELGLIRDFVVATLRD